MGILTGISEFMKLKNGETSKYRSSNSYTLTEEDRDASAETRRMKQELKKMELENQRLEMQFELEEKKENLKLEREERLQRFRELKEMREGGGSMEDMALMTLLEKAMSSQQQNNSQPSQAVAVQQVPAQNNEEPQQPEETSRFTDEQIKKHMGTYLNPEVLNFMKSMNETEWWQVYDVIKSS